MAIFVRRTAKKTDYRFLRQRNCLCSGTLSASETGKIPFNIERLESLFCFDDHSLWVKSMEKGTKTVQVGKILTYTPLGANWQKHRIQTEVLEIKKRNWRNCTKTDASYQISPKICFSQGRNQLDEDKLIIFFIILE